MPKLVPVTENDLHTLRGMIADLALHEGRPEAATLTEQDLRVSLLEKKLANAWLVEYEGSTAGYIVTYPVFSTFTGRANLYLEDLFVLPALRGKGLGRSLMALVASEAKKQGCATLQWSCLDSNLTSLAFYESLGAKRKPHGTSFYLAL